MVDIGTKLLLHILWRETLAMVNDHVFTKFLPFKFYSTKMSIIITS